MLLTSVILILQETLEAAFLVAILAAATVQTGHRLRWLTWGFLAGCALGAVYAINLDAVSESFDYVGQELTNAALQLAIATAIVPLTWLIVRAHLRGRAVTELRAAAAARPGARTGALYSLLCSLTIMLAITREGSEIMVYLGGFLEQPDKVQTVLAGSAIGFGIGISIGLLTFYGLMALGGGRGRWIPVVLLALFCGNMLAQAAMQLTQADWLQGGVALWDSSSVVPEQSITGRMLYALLGYESSPSLAQFLAYVAGVAAVVAAALAVPLAGPRAGAPAKRSSP